MVKEYIIENEIKDEVSKIEFIFDYLDSVFSTIFRQIAYTSFEKNAHTAAYNNEALSYEDYDKLYLNELDEMYGDNLKDSYKWNSTWQRVPHIYNTPFYCYSYAFGNILAFNLYNKYKTMDKSEFKEIYINILSAGCSKKPYDLLLENGIDIKEDSFYTTAFEVIEKYINIIENNEVNNLIANKKLAGQTIGLDLVKQNN